MENKNFKIHFIQHASWVVPAEYLLWAERNGYQYTFTKVYEFEALPTNVDADMLIVLGGPQNPATTLDECPFFNAEKEKELINLYVSRGRIVIGSCLGAQLLGDALGAGFYHSPYPEVGPVRANLTKEGREDPFLKDFPDSFDLGEWHNDMPGLTHSSILLAYSDGCPHQIVKYGKFAYGFQAHMELNHDAVVGMIDAHNSDTVVHKGPYVKTNEEILAYDFSEMNRLLSSFLDNIVEAYLNR